MPKSETKVLEEFELEDCAKVTVEEQKKMIKKNRKAMALLTVMLPKTKLHLIGDSKNEDWPHGHAATVMRTLEEEHNPNDSMTPIEAYKLVAQCRMKKERKTHQLLQPPESN